jgi:hypothetical protein
MTQYIGHLSQCSYLLILPSVITSRVKSKTSVDSIKYPQSYDEKLLFFYSLKFSAFKKCYIINNELKEERIIFFASLLTAH